MTDLRQAAQAVLDAWDSPLWKTGTTAAKIADLRAALAREHAMHDLARLGQEIEQQAEPVAVYQWRKQGCADWYDGHPDYSDCGGPYETRTLRIAAMQVHPLEFCQMVEGKETVTGIPMYWAEWPSKEVV
jgi:hypothetical protein